METNEAIRTANAILSGPVEWGESAEKRKKILQDYINNKLKSVVKENSVELERIQTDGSLLKDFIIPLGNGVGTNRFVSNGNVKFRMIPDKDKGLMEDFSLHQHSIVQISERYSLPTRFMRELFSSEKQWQRDLSAEIFNEHILHSDRKRLLFRTISEQIRGVLSSNYKRMNSDFIYRRFLEAVENLGMKLVDVGYSETKTWLEAVFPKVMMFTTPRNGIQHVCFGCRLSTSDFGDGALELRFYMYKAWCLNGAVGASELRKIHSGKQIPDNIQLSNQTLEYETKYHAGLIYDSTMDVLSKDSINNKIVQIQKASANEIDFVKTLEKLPKMGMLKEEIEQLTNVFTSGKLEDGVEGENTTYKLSQAISAVARGKEVRRKRELEELAGGLIF